MTARKKATRSSRRFSPHARALPPSAASCAVLAAAGVLVCSAALAQSARIPANALPTGPAGQALANGSATLRQPQIISGSFNPYAVSGNTATITQNDAAGILRWAGFDIGSAAQVIVNQPSATAVLLNKVDSGHSKTVIEGMLKGNGQVYIYNPSGIIFGKNSTVNVNSLVATTLKIDDNRFLAGLTAPNAAPIFAKESGFTPGAVTVEGDAASQAQITAGRGGKILLIGSSVSNSGRLYAPDGQVLLAAASDKVYLSAPSDVTMRGLLVEVGTGGTVRNERLGQILVERGNASMVGFAVNQDGRISATTSVQANGSIYLRARDGAQKDNAVLDVYTTRGGKLTLGADSVTEILPDLQDKDAEGKQIKAAKSSYNPSKIDLAGQSVHLEANAKVTAPGGVVTVTAQVDPKTRSTDGIRGGTVGGSGVYMEAGATIDVSGTTNTELAMESNVIPVDLRGTELADVPLQRSSVLRGKTVNIDRRKGTPLANVQGWLDLIEYSVGELTAAGGTVTFNADQDVVMAGGSNVNVSGGKVSYRSGHIVTTQLQSGNYSVDIGSATPDRIYTGFYDTAAGPRNFEAGYSEGYSAGSVRFNAAALVLRGNLVGTTTPGARQRDITASNYPKGGELVIGGSSRIDSSSLTNYPAFGYLGKIDFGGTSTASIATPLFGSAWAATDPAMQTLRSTVDVDPAQLAAHGFTRINAYTRSDTRPDGDAWGSMSGSVAVNTSVTIKPGGEFRVAAEEAVALNRDIGIPGGTVEAVAATSQLAVGANVSINVAGLWTNDRSTPAPARDALGNPTTAIVTQGGSIALSGKGTLTNAIGLAVGDGAQFDASGGAWQNSAGKTVSGSGGAISLVAGAADPTLPSSAGLVLGKNVDFRSYGLAKGGSLKLSGRNVVLGPDTSDDPLDLAFGSSFFTRGGFSKYDISAAGNLIVAAGATIAPRMDNWIANGNTWTAAGGRMADAFTVGTLPLGGPQGSRGATSLSLTAAAKLTDTAGRLWLQAGSVIETDPGATVTLAAGRQLTADGRITDHGGTVNLLLTVDPTDPTQVYRAERSIWLGSTAVVDVSGSAARLWTNSKGLTQGELLDGGSIRIGRLNGSALAPATGYVVIDESARLDVSGSRATMTLAQNRGSLTTRPVASAGGSIDSRAREGLLVDGQLSGAGGDASVAGGSLNLVLDGEDVAGPAGSPNAERDLVVLRRKPHAGTAAESIVPPALHADQAIDSAFEGKGYVLASTLNAGGFDRIRLKSQNKVSFDAAGGDSALSARAEVAIDAPVLAASNAAGTSTIRIGADHVSLGNTDWRYQADGAAAAVGDGATLAVNATTIDVTGNSVLQGFARADFTATADIRLSGVVAQDLSLDAPVSLPAIHAVGSLIAAGDMNLTAGQVYPTTMSEFALTSTGSGSTIRFRRNGATPSAPLSAAGRLAINADHIVQAGVVRAPFGSLSFTAADTLSFGAGSLTSVAGSGSVPLGRISNGRNWLYDFGNGHTVTLNDSKASNSVTLPEKQIVTNAPAIDVTKDAEIDLSGGGDLYAYEFTAGPGGSRDVLAKTTGASAATVFAILPNYDSSTAPLDFQYQQDGGLQVGDRIYLSAIPGLAAGYYTLLPAHYALFKGGYAVTLASGTRDMSAAVNRARTDGTWVVAGYRGSAVASDSRWSGFLVTSSDQVRLQSEFTNYSANTMLAGTTAILPKDGGHLAFAASRSLTLDGLIKLGAMPGGKGGMADISAPDITIVADKSKAGGSGVKLDATELAALGADSLMLGGIRDIQADGTHVAVGADTVTLANDAAHPLTGPEIILAAKDEVRLTGGSAISSKGTPGSAGGDLIIDGSGAAADGALLRVSGDGQVAVVRDAPAGSKGTLTIENGATIGATGSMNLDATKTFNNKGTLALGTGAALGLGANRISFGQAVPASVDGLRFDNAALTSLNALSSLSLTSYTTFDVYGAANLGSAATKMLSLRGAGIQSYGGAGDTVSLTAETVRFDGGGTYTLSRPATGASGTLSVAATDIEIGSKSFAVKGFANASLTAQREVRAVGKAGGLVAENDMTVAAGRITATSGSDAGVQAGGKLTLTRVANPQAPSATDSLGGKLRFTGNSIVSDADIVAHAGQVAFAAANGLHVAGGTIDASGSAKTFGSTVAYAPGGTITLDGGNGNVTVDAAATLDVSATGADAGLIAVTATNGSNGQATIDGTLKGNSIAGVDRTEHAQGRFALDVDSLGAAAKFATLNDKLNAGGFTESRSVRVRHDDIVVNDKRDASNVQLDAITAHQVVLAADNGNVTVGGSINADGTKGGSIEIYASQAGNHGGSGNVTLQSTAVLSAKATQAADGAAGSTGDGGRVEIGTATADGTMVATANNSSIDLQTGARIDVSGNGGQGGTVTLRAPRVGSGAGSEVAIAHLGATIKGSRETAIEGFKTYTGNQITAAADSATNLNVGTGGKMYTDASTFAGNSATMLARLGAGADVKLRAGVEVRSPGDLLVSVNESAANAQDRGWNLNAWRFNGEPGTLTLRAAGNLNVQGSISDGFVRPATKVAMPGWQLDSSGGASSSYRLAGGADHAAANPLAVKANSSTGDVTLNFARTASVANDQPVALIRTGTGNIDVAAGRDVVLGSTTVDIPDPYDSSKTVSAVLGATIYTAGRFAPLDSNFLAPKNQTVNPIYTNGAKVATTARFAEYGGAITVAAARDVIGAVTRQDVNGWLFRRGKVTTDAAGNTVFSGPLTTDGNTPTTRYEAVLSTGWWTRYDYFNQGIATFGGGDISVSAGRNAEDLSLNVATSGQLPGTAPGQYALVERGGGDISLRAGGDVRGGSFYVQKGAASISATGAVVAGKNTVPDEELGTVTLRPIFALGDGRIDVTAGGNLEIETVYNPTLVRQSVYNASTNTSLRRQSPLSWFSTYQDDGAVTLTSTAGDVVFGNHPLALSTAAAPWISELDATYLVYPSSLRAVAMQGRISYQNGFSLWPSATGQLELLAAKSVTADFPKRALGALAGQNIAGTQPIAMIDASPSSLPNINAPVTVIDSEGDILNPATNKDGLAYHTNGGLHTGDTTGPARIIALTGDIVGESYFGTSSLDDTLILAKAAEIIAGRDIVNLGFRIQHVDANDVTTISAGRDFVDSTYAGLSPVRHNLSGPGRLDITAGRNIDLGTSGGIVTRGNLDNPYLPDSGASINLVAGAKADYARFVATYLTAQDLPAADQAALVRYMQALDASLPAGLGTADALTLFKALPAAQQTQFLSTRKPLLNDIFFTKVRLALGSGSSGGYDLAAFDAVIESLYPAADISGGDINVFGSQIKTTRGGSINMFAPGGSVQAGLAEKPAWVKAKLNEDKSFESNLGIYTIAGGNLQALVRNDFLVNQGRVFTLGGGDISLVSQYGNIDAGKGAKTAQSTPPPVIRTDEKGNTIVDISASISGSGIATLKTNPRAPASSVHVLAPRGYFDAGDAGVRCGLECDIRAPELRNSGNIVAGSGKFSESSTPTMSAATTSAPASPPPTNTEALAKTDAGDPNAATSLRVELLGYGGGDSQAPVTQDSQNGPPARADDDRKKKPSP